MRSASRLLVWLLPLYAAVATAVGSIDHRVRPEPDHAFTHYIPTVVEGSAEAPGRYRILGPMTYVGLQRVTGLAQHEAWILFRWLCLFAALLCGHLFFRAWFDDRGALAGNLVIMSLLPLTMTNSWSHPDHLMELWLFLLSSAAIVRRWGGVFLATLVLAALNRETSLLLVLAFAVAEPISRRQLIWTAGAGLIWIVVFLGLRLQLGWVTYSPWNLGENWRLLFWWPLERDVYYRLYSWFFLVLLAPLFVCVWVSWQRLPRFVKGAGLVVSPLFVIVGLLFSSVIEPRIFTPLLVFLAPAVLFAAGAENAFVRPKTA